MQKPCPCTSSPRPKLFVTAPDASMKFTGGSERNIIQVPPLLSGMIPIAAPQVIPSGNVGQLSVMRYGLLIVVVVRRASSSSGLGGGAFAGACAPAAAPSSALTAAATAPNQDSAARGTARAPASRAAWPDCP